MAEKQRLSCDGKVWRIPVNPGRTGWERGEKSGFWTLELAGVCTYALVFLDLFRGPGPVVLKRAGFAPKPGKAAGRQ